MRGVSRTGWTERNGERNQLGNPIVKKAQRWWCDKDEWADGEEGGDWEEDWHHVLLLFVGKNPRREWACL